MRPISLSGVWEIPSNAPAILQCKADVEVEKDIEKVQQQGKRCCPTIYYLHTPFLTSPIISYLEKGKGTRDGAHDSENSFSLANKPPMTDELVIDE